MYDILYDNLLRVKRVACISGQCEYARTGEREAFDRMQRMRSLEFARAEGAKLRDLLPARGVGAGVSIH